MIEKIHGELITFLSEDMVTLNGFLVRRKGKACLIYVHGMGSGFYRQLPLVLSHELKSISTFSINTRGHDELTWLRKGKNRRQFLAGTGAERFEECVYDLGGAIRAMRKMGFQKFILAGHSTGCQKVAYYQYKRRDGRVKAVILFAPADDYGLREKNPATLKKAVSLSRKLKTSGKYDVPAAALEFFTPRRTLSVSDLKNVEARMFYYNGKLSEFSRIKAPVCALFGSEEQYADRAVEEYLQILADRTNSSNFRGIIIEGANHSFWELEKEAALAVAGWLREINV